MKRRRGSGRTFLERNRRSFTKNKGRRPLFEFLEPRVLLTADFSFDATSQSDTVYDWKLTADDNYLKVVDLADESSVLAQQLLTVNNGMVTITGSSYDESLSVDLSTLSSLVSVSFSGGAGNDSVTVAEDLVLSGNLSLAAETITVDSNINADGNVTLTAYAADTTTVTATGSVIDRIATINISGDITAGGDLLVTATAERNIDITSDASSLSINSTTTAEIFVDHSSEGESVEIWANNLELTASTEGSVTSTNTYWIGAAANDFTDSATVDINEVEMSATTLNISASRDTEYSVEGRDAFNNISGDSSIQINQADLTSRSGDVSVSSSTSLDLAAHSPELEYLLDEVDKGVNLDASSARNRVAGDTLVTINDSALTVGSGGALAVNASRNVQAEATAETDSIVWTNSYVFGYTFDADGAYTANHLTGDVKGHRDRWVHHDRFRERFSHGK